MKLLKNLLIGACILSFLVLLGIFNATKPRILVLQSGSQESPWVREVDRGMRQALGANRRPVSVEWVYMAATSPASTRRVEEAAAEAHRAIGRVNPDVLIAVDDEANSLVARDYVGRASPRILYVSLDRPPSEYDYVGAPNVSGIAEQLPWTAIRDAVTQLYPGPKRTVALIGVDTATGRAEMAQAHEFDWGPVTLGGTALVSTAGEWRDFVGRSAAADVLLVLSTQDLPDTGGVVLTAADVSRWTQDHAVPLPIGTQVDFVEAGGALSFAPPPDDFGQRAIGLALDWLDDRDTPGPPPPVQSSHFEVALRQGRLAERGITVPPIYIEAARENGTLLD